MTDVDAAPATLPKPKLRGVSHQIAFFVTLVAGPALVLFTRPGAARINIVIYAVCLSALFGVSAAFHRITWQPAARRRMRRLDHSMIFLFIAGTYTAIVLSLDSTVATWILVVVWAGALGGVTLKLAWLDAPQPLSATMYIALGWVAILALPWLYSALGPVGFALLAGGGICYTLGAIAYARRSPDPVPSVFGYHEVFHACVILAAICHYCVIAFWAVPKVAG